LLDLRDYIKQGDSHLTEPIAVSGKTEEIIRVASKLFIKKGVRETTMRELAAALGMTTGGL
jgi:AcrR family transcriptional regulator